MTNEITIFDNPSVRCPVMLLLDTSGSMNGYPIQALNRGVNQFFEEIQSDEIARFSVETSIITFGGRVKKVLPFTVGVEKINTPGFSARGMTPLGEALDLAINEIKKQRDFYKENGISAYKPWIIVMSDGMPNDNWHSAAEKAKAQSDAGQLIYLGVGVGNNIDMNYFSKLLPANRPPKKLDGLKFVEFFQWLSDSLKSVSQSAPGQQVNIPSTSGWESINV